MSETIRAQANAAIASVLKVDHGRVSEQADIVKDLGGDSLHTVEMAMAFEEVFSIEIPDEHTADLQTVGAVHEYLIGRVIGRA